MIDQVVLLTAQVVGFVAVAALAVYNTLKVRQLKRLRDDIDKRVEDADKHFDERRQAFIEERQAMEVGMADRVSALVSERTGADIEMEIERVEPVARTRGKLN